MSDTPILLASSRTQGNTRRVAEKLAVELQAAVIDLTAYTIYPFRYEQVYPADDDFIRLVEEQLLSRETLVFASPVYWYSMSGQMKIFFDRLSDLLKSRKDLGRQLRGKWMAVLSCAEDEVVTDTFYAAFRLSAAYLGMQYGPEWHGWLEEGTMKLAKRPTEYGQDV
jgi:multimeric flavodoxin WrbA